MSVTRHIAVPPKRTVGGIHDCIGRIMAVAKVATDSFLLRAIALGSCAVIVGILSWTLASLMTSTQKNANRLTAIETTLNIMQKDIERIAND